MGLFRGHTSKMTSILAPKQFRSLSIYRFTDQTQSTQASRQGPVAFVSKHYANFTLPHQLNALFDQRTDVCKILNPLKTHCNDPGFLNKVLIQCDFFLWFPGREE